MTIITMATRQASPAMRRSTTFYMLCSLSFIITIASKNVPALAENSSPPPSTLVLYSHQNVVPPDATLVPVATPSGLPIQPPTVEFGTTFVVGDILRETEAADSPLLGFIAGLAVVEKDLSLYSTITFVLNTTTFAGTISAQGTADPQGNGEYAITGGTYDFRFARGYVDVTLVSNENPRDRVLKLVFTIKYD